MTLVSQDARVGRHLADAFECYGTPAVGGVPGLYNGSYQPGGGNVPCGVWNIGFLTGSTLTQNMSNVDMLVIELGTNDLSLPLGQMGDSTQAGTFYGNLRWVVETYLGANPSMRIVLVTPQFTTFTTVPIIQQYVNAMIAYGYSMGVPVINMFALGGVNSITYPTLTLDGTHPNPYGYNNFYGPVIAQGLLKVF